ncbi:NF-X1-type zinc finger protein NFXL2 isoform X2 [Triticum urartu]|uniref:RING-type domain-containing protein n=1 Tax=Triticum urartu TaxID=4572 RepID=A0A8R7PPA6_TRIUA|nr:NF-X1-type zinc finger protein NFXL2 isoform X2 [Triticum urartu]
MPSSYAAAAASSSRKPAPFTTATATTRKPAPLTAPAPPPPNPSHVSDSDPSSYSSSGEETDLSACDPATASVLSTYLSVAGNGADLSKVGIFLNSAARRRSPPCLICLDPIRPSDPVWSCSASCFALLHLPCIQSWAHQSASAAPSPTWGCPKCRVAYPKSQTPTSYHCFCSKTEDPPADPWILPHSCGDVCGRRLNSNPDSGCEHTCLLLCHPGPCPPCPAVVPNARCFCGAHREPRRCAHQRYSCKGKCNKRLSCELHRCPVDCHDGPCPPCAVRGNHKCECGETMVERLCSERVFQCKRECSGMLECGKHRCERGCHGGKCGECPLRGQRTCPCGKKDYPRLECDVEAATCGSTCEKVLGCGRHKCPERCHRGPCDVTCRLVIKKSCRCGVLKKELPCHQDLTCERKCQRLRACGRHACKRRCCVGDCPPCAETCDRRLRCGNHKCLSPCHRGACSPCPLMKTISCFCGKTYFEVPCGTEKNQKPPKCSKRCNIDRLCRHKLDCRPHKCHYGACPPCKLICGEELSCGHKCKERCHGSIPPPNPEFTVKPMKKKMEKHIECTPGTPCPPCQEVVLVPCFGEHLGQERAIPCSKSRQFPCQNLCGNLLHCGNHYCTKDCHVLEIPSDQRKADTILSLSRNNTLAEPCERCNLRCQRARDPPCSHPCPLRCHLSDCLPCKVLVKKSCHCGAMTHAFECVYYNNLNAKQQLKARSCSGPCHRKLPNCPHLCSEICHPGQCPSVDQCMKKVNVRCACNTLKKEWVCQDVLKEYRRSGRDPKEVPKGQFGVGLLACGGDCVKKVNVSAAELHLRKVHETKSPAAEVANVPKRRKKRDRGAQEPVQVSMWQQIKWYLVVIIALAGLVVLGLVIWKGVYQISDWMNEMEEQKARERLLRAGRL